MYQKVYFCNGSNQKKEKLEILFILLNHNWLFPNLLEVDFSIINEQIQIDLENLFINCIAEKGKKILEKTTMYDMNTNTKPRWDTHSNKNDINNIHKRLSVIGDTRLTINNTTISNEN